MIFPVCSDVRPNRVILSSSRAIQDCPLLEPLQTFDVSIGLSDVAGSPPLG